jgi:hypothetical protein
MAFENEKVEHIETIRSEEVSGILAIGNQGTIMMYYKFVDDSTVHLQQFNIQAPIYSLDKIQVNHTRFDADLESIISFFRVLIMLRLMGLAKYP